MVVVSAQPSQLCSLAPIPSAPLSSTDTAPFSIDQETLFFTPPSSSQNACRWSWSQLNPLYFAPSYRHNRSDPRVGQLHSGWRGRIIATHPTPRRPSLMPSPPREECPSRTQRVDDPALWKDPLGGNRVCNFFIFFFYTVLSCMGDFRMLFRRAWALSEAV